MAIWVYLAVGIVPLCALAVLVYALVAQCPPPEESVVSRLRLKNPAWMPAILLIGLCSAIWLFAAMTYWLGGCVGGLKGPAECAHIPQALGQLAFNLMLFLFAHATFVLPPFIALLCVIEAVTRWRLRHLAKTADMAQK